jgi:aminopeptidase N
MQRLLFTALFLVLCAGVSSDSARSNSASPRSARFHHDLKITLHPDRHSFDAEDRITVPDSRGSDVDFVLHRGLEPKSSTPDVSLIRQPSGPGDGPVESYRVSLPRGVRTFVLTFHGQIHHPLESYEKETARGSLSTPGLISKEGVFLSGDSYWYPQFNEDLLGFDLEVTVPHDWDVMSQGERTLHEIRDGSRRVRWHCEAPQEELALVAAPFFVFSRPAGQIQTMVFLREPDKALAGKYLDATAPYLAMYEGLIGPYPYKKFALVENYWETGYGMPSFALMGSKVIRFPFIISSSYPHEILHNWWGNSVYPDVKSGNWSEGLTAYLADHLLREQRGAAAEYRRDTLQKYTDYVSKKNDFPLTRFRSRHSAATQAIGYGKALMFFHMLRMDLGDRTFREGLRDFYRNSKFRFASYEDVRKSFEGVSGKDLTPVFTQWVTRPGAPQLKVSDARMKKRGGKYLVTALLEQTQPGDAYRVHIPVAITMEGRDHAYQTRVLMQDKQQEVQLTVPCAPLRIDVDPEFDVFRRLAQGEIPPALTQIFGAKQVTLIAPTRAHSTVREALGALAQDWRASGPEEVHTLDDDQIETLPPDTSVVILGWENRFADVVRAELAPYGVTVSEEGLTIGERTFPRKGLSVVFTVRNPKNVHTVVTWVASDRVKAISGLARKVPHYHGFSYLVFTGDDPSNVAKGHWPVLGSPMTLSVRGPDGSMVKRDRGKLAERKPLAVLPSR